MCIYIVIYCWKRGAKKLKREFGGGDKKNENYNTIREATVHRCYPLPPQSVAFLQPPCCIPSTPYIPYLPFITVPEPTSCSPSRNPQSSPTSPSPLSRLHPPQPLPINSLHLLRK